MGEASNGGVYEESDMGEKSSYPRDNPAFVWVWSIKYITDFGRDFGVCRVAEDIVM